jgi:glucose/arabinose dehydrogenase
MFNSTLFTPSSLYTSPPLQHQRRRRRRRLAMSVSVQALGITMMGFISANAQAPAPSVTDSNLAVRTVVSGLSQPVTMAFLAPGDFFVTEKASGKLLHVVNGVVVSTVIQLPVNSASERGLLGISLHPRFKDNHFVYLYWTESSTGFPTNSLADVGNPDSPFPPGTPQPLGNRVDRFVWDPVTDSLTYDRNLIRLHAFQADAGQPLRGNHNGGIIRFQKSDDLDDDQGDDDGQKQHGRNGKHRGHADDHGNTPAKLLIIIGDNGRRGVLQNLIDGPFGPGIPDDQFGGPEPDNNHLTGVVLRLNDDGTTPEDNPFFQLGEAMGGEAGTNLQKIFAYGIRNSFGMAVDPRTGALWESENGDDSFDEINRIEPGHNGGWVQIMGPLARLAEFKAIETSTQFFGLQQIRWSPTNIASTPAEALSRLVMLPGAHYADPQFSWKFAVAPAGIGFMRGTSLGHDYNGDLFAGASTPALEKGYLFRFKLARDRTRLVFSDPRLADLVADNTNKFEITESESLLFGSGFGIGTDIQSGPKGGLFVVSLSNGAVYEIYRVARGRDD